MEVIPYATASGSYSYQSDAPISPVYTVSFNILLGGSDHQLGSASSDAGWSLGRLNINAGRTKAVIPLSTPGGTRVYYISDGAVFDITSLNPDFSNASSFSFVYVVDHL